jgi:riboflavin kinase/FMN adenylyltransferase
MQTYTGVVQQGAKRGAALGFPTANIPLDDPDLSGIYVGRATVSGNSYGAAVYADRGRSILEVHLLDFAGDLYGITISVEILAKIRDGVHFENDTLLKVAIAEDIAHARGYLQASH